MKVFVSQATAFSIRTYYFLQMKLKAALLLFSTGRQQLKLRCYKVIRGIYPWDYKVTTSIGYSKNFKIQVKATFQNERLKPLKQKLFQVLRWENSYILQWRFSKFKSILLYPKIDTQSSLWSRYVREKSKINICLNN